MLQRFFSDETEAFRSPAEPDIFAVACNNLDEEQQVQLRLRTLGVPDGCAVASRLRTTDDGFDASVDAVGHVTDGILTTLLPAKSTLVLCKPPAK